ncbi:haloacid dehalogenase type II [Bradyrhizobium sp. WYCCWR 13022]|uniref:haloacid dehalogenase type II n=1 Tax=unclassified Bradyrhizobium TaxID=2631580 RepID=UPI00263BCCCD|nr:haloacid dehalogenase type II [Bradyrhizobium sp. WYCCWR 13022]MDN4985575.1 haloacid dehalogenase type II [Bradyrhizobium sp. WYCCWR 13022]
MMQNKATTPMDRRKLLSGLGTAAVGGVTAKLLGHTGPANAAAARDTSDAPSILVFDVNETLLDIEYISPVFERVFNDRKVMREWFNQLILYSDAVTLSGPYVTFFDLGQGILKMLGTIHGAKVTASDIDDLRTRMLTMPAHPDVLAGLKQLKDAGFRLVSFTNSPPDQKASPLKHAGLSEWFERSFSVDRVRRFKPAAQGYHLVAEELNVAPSSLCMVAAHVWDTIGAQSVGYSGALITRSGNAPLLVDQLPQPQIVAPDLPGVAAQAIRLWRS